VCNTVDCSATAIKSECTSTTNKECYTADEYESFELPHPANWTEVEGGEWMMIPNDYIYASEEGDEGVIDEEINPDAVKYTGFRNWLNNNMKWNFVTNCDYFNYGLDPDNAEQQWNSGNENRGNNNMMRRSSTFNGKDFVVDPKGEWYMQLSSYEDGNPYVQVTLPAGYDKVRISYRQPKGLGNVTWEGIDGGSDLKDDPIKRGILKVTLNDTEISRKEGPSFTETLEWGKMNDNGFYPKLNGNELGRSDYGRYDFAHTMFAIAKPENAHSTTETGWIDYTAEDILKIEGIHPKDIPQNDYYYSPYWWECENEYGYYSVCGSSFGYDVPATGPLGTGGRRRNKASHDSRLAYCRGGPWEKSGLCTESSNPDRDAAEYADVHWYRHNCGRGCFVANSAEDSIAPINNTKWNEYGGDGSTANRNMFKHTTAIGGKFKIEVIKTR
tara:strand:- start:3733 stop:5058 length:1326 start_codon:yes stop_codon:yes gene_type:complete